MSDDTYRYRTVPAAAARFARLYGELPGQVRGIDYERMHLALCNPSPSAEQEAALDRLQEFSELKACFQRACLEVGWPKMRTWLAVRVVGIAVTEAAQAEGLSRSGVYRRLGVVDKVVLEELIERDAVRGYGDRDLLEAGGAQAKGVCVVVDQQAMAWAKGDE